MIGKKVKIIAAAILAVIIFLAGYIGYKKYYPLNQNEEPAAQNIQPESTNKPEIPAEKPSSEKPMVLAGYKLYKNSEFGFEIQYPEKWTVGEENIENIRGENTKAFYFKKPNSDLRFVILPRDGLSYGLPSEDGTSSQIFIGGFPGIQQKWTLSNDQRLWLLYPQYSLHGWSQDIGRIDILSSTTDPAGDTIIFEQMLNSFKLSK